ncbi:MAG: AzlC family ABC transporter permease, partial [Caldilineales bacterium]|nr:AzlC family ABC transporter permease [Caldilineales bacterium]
IYGVVALASGLPPLPTVAMSSIVFAGSAQFIGARLIGLATPGFVVVLTTFIVNLRHALYSFSLAPYLQNLPGRWRWLLAYLLTDEAYAVTVLHYREDGAPAAHKHWFWLGSGLTLWLVWQLSTLGGVVLGAQVPASWQLDFTLPLTFIGILVPVLKERPAQAAALSAGLVAVAAFALPYKLGLMLAASVGIVVGLWWERRA